MTTILSGGVPFYNGFGVSSEDVYYKREVVEVILVEISGGIKDEYLFRVASSGKLLPGGYKVSENFRSSFLQASSPESKLIATPMDKRVGNLRTQRKLRSCFKVNERIKCPRPFTMEGVLYWMTTVILP